MGPRWGGWAGAGQAEGWPGHGAQAAAWAAAAAAGAGAEPGHTCLPTGLQVSLAVQCTLAQEQLGGGCTLPLAALPWDVGAVLPAIVGAGVPHVQHRGWRTGCPCVCAACKLTLLLLLLAAPSAAAARVQTRRPQMSSHRRPRPRPHRHPQRCGRHARSSCTRVLLMLLLSLGDPHLGRPVC